MTTLITYIRRHHIGLLALFVALGGSAYAATQTGTKEIKDDSVRSIDVRDETLRGADVKDGTIRAKELADDLSVSDATASVTLVGDSSGVQMFNNQGVTGFSNPEKGLYVLELSSPAPRFCDALATPIFGTPNAPAPALSVTPPSGNETEVFIRLGKTNGTPANLNESGFDYSGVSVRVYC